MASDPLQNPEPAPIADEQAKARAFERHQALAVGALALPNLFLRSALTLGLLYGLLGLVLITIVQFGLLTPAFAVAIGVAVIVLQFVLGPWIMDLTLYLLYDMRWVKPEELPEHLEAFVRRVCGEHRMRVPWFGIINDGAPQAFTYGHHPGNARVVISRGLMDLLTPEELEAVVAHELGHSVNWDMALMTLANLVPLLLYYIYDLAWRWSEGDNDAKGKVPAWAVSAGAYVLYVVSQYIVLWFSRTREYYADRFAGQATGNPNALASALVKIAYGLAAQHSKEFAGMTDKERAAARKEKATSSAGAFGALNIADRGSAVALVMSSAGPDGGTEVDRERVKGAMQWDLWNPWATYYELHSTHPLTAKRLLHLSDQASALGGEPYVVFDRAKPKSYWPLFLADLWVLSLPWVGMLAAVGTFAGMGMANQGWHFWLFGVGLSLLGLGLLAIYRRQYPRGVNENVTVANLLHRVEVSPVRTVKATLTGKIIGKGVPGLVWSEDFVIQDPTGILFLDYQQPLGLWNWLFGLLRAGRYQGKEVRVHGWFRRAPAPYLQIDSMEVIDGSEPTRRCYTSWATLWVNWFLVGLGAVIAVALAVALR
jgi:Zn-dependent protease with chaperone function